MKKSPYTRAETWAIRPDNHNLGDGGSDAGHFSKSVRSGAPPVSPNDQRQPALDAPLRCGPPAVTIDLESPNGSGGWPTFAPPRTRLQHASRFSKGAAHTSCALVPLGATAGSHATVRLNPCGQNFLSDVRANLHTTREDL